MIGNTRAKQGDSLDYIRRGNNQKVKPICYIQVSQYKACLSKTDHKIEIQFLKVQVIPRQMLKILKLVALEFILENLSGVWRKSLGEMQWFSANT